MRPVAQHVQEHLSPHANRHGRNIGVDLAIELGQGRAQGAGGAEIEDVECVVDAVHIAEQRRRRCVIESACNHAGIAAARARRVGQGIGPDSLPVDEGAGV